MTTKRATQVLGEVEYTNAHKDRVTQNLAEVEYANVHKDRVTQVLAMVEYKPLDVLVAKDISAGIPTVDKPTIGQVHALTGKDISSGAPSVDKPTLSEVEVHLYDEFITSSILQQRAEYYRLKDEEEAIILLAVMELL